MARRLDVSQPTISRIDRGETLPSMPRVRAWLDACEVHGAERRQLLELAEAAHGETRPWRELLHDDVTHLQHEAQRRERDAVAVSNYQPTVVPGLLQTPEYARAVLELGRSRDVDAGVATRIERQQLLHEESHRFHFVIAEHVLRWPLGGVDVSAAQRDRVLSIARLPTVDLAVLPGAAAVALGWHNFILWTPVEGDPYVTTELTHGAQEIHDPNDVALYQQLWARLRAAAVTGDDAVELLKR